MNREVGLALIPYSAILPPTLTSRMFSVGVKRHKEGADSDGGQLRGDRVLLEWRNLFSGRTCWKVPESDAGSVV